MFGKIVVPFAMLLILFVIFPYSAAGQSGIAQGTDSDRGQTCAHCNRNLPRISIDGWKGTPYSTPQPDGCRCGQESSVTWYNGSRHWPNPFSVLLDHGRDGQRWGRRTDTTTPRLVDKLDVLSNIRLLPSVRKDNGYAGPHCDPYGLLGESRRGMTSEQANPSIIENTRRESPLLRYPVDRPQVTESAIPAQHNQMHAPVATKKPASPRYPLLSPTASTGPKQVRQMAPGRSYPRRYPLDSVSDLK